MNSRNGFWPEIRFVFSWIVGPWLHNLWGGLKQREKMKHLLKGVSRHVSACIFGEVEVGRSKFEANFSCDSQL